MLKRIYHHGISVYDNWNMGRCEMKLITSVVSESGRRRGLVCMSIDQRHLRTFNEATEALQLVSQLFPLDEHVVRIDKGIWKYAKRKHLQKKNKRHDIGD